ncbi:hypothetical protein TOPB45_1588 [Thermodesulfobacterium geofontis OPF15]|jgi:hypothetical protein|uniref:DUF2703 domain-containing protein n=1 Tax=Thermodesulfobacterium geofontis (strain OPF15) TaxID=795359 RepID=F8C3U6_THEGP|nr:DUF2703 domain-containing protein [Thermodesulfobacterium geofontis]AEH23666.1 hypothetical protein TOPB45_1588 [Thermodesulfobacterium geofontis OPF15]
MNTLKIKWQRLLINGKTCPRCKLTEEELEKDISILKQYLNPLGIEIICRTIKVGNRVYETIPAELIVKAGLLAALQLIKK